MIAIISAIVLFITAIKASPACVINTPAIAASYTPGQSVPISATFSNLTTGTYTFDGTLSQLLNSFGPQQLDQATISTNTPYTLTGTMTIPTYFTAGVASLLLVADSGNEPVQCSVPIVIAALPTPTPTPCPSPCYPPSYPCYNNYLSIPCEPKRYCKVPKTSRRCRIYSEEVENGEQAFEFIGDQDDQQQQQQQQQFDEQENQVQQQN